MNHNTLSKYLSPLNTWALAFGAAVGWGTFVMPGTTFLPLAGTLGTALGLFFGAITMLIIGMNYYFMMKDNSEPGGAFAYTKKFFGYDHGFLVAWFLVLAYTSIIWANSTALSLIARRLTGDFFQFGFHYTLVGFDVYFGEVALSVIALLIFGGICLTDKKVAANVQTAMALFLFFGIIYCFVSVMQAHEGGLKTFEPAFVPGMSPNAQIAGIVALAPWAFVGFEAISNSTEEFNFSVKKTFAIMTAALIAGTAAYIFAAGTAGAILPPEYSNWLEYISDLGNLEGLKSLPTFYAVNEVLGSFGLKILGLVALAAIGTGILGNYIAASRLMYSMAEHNILPPKFAELNKHGSPVNAIIFLMIVAIIIPFFGRTAISWIIDLLSVCAVIAYGYTSAAAFSLACEVDNFKFQISGIVGILLSLIFGLFLLIPNLLSITTMAAESYMILVLWSMLGFLFFRNLFRHDKERQFGKSLIVYIVMLFMIFFGSLMWMRQSSDEIMKQSLTKMEEYYIERLNSPRLQAGEYRRDADDVYTDILLDDVRYELFRHSTLQIILIVLGLAIMFNIYSTMRKRENRAEIKKVQAEKNSKAKTMFLSNMSHDIRTPMNAIMGFTGLALKELDNPERVKDYLEKIQNSGGHLLSLINDILEMSRIESGKLELETTEVDLKKMFAEVYDMFINQMQEKKIDFTVDTSAVKDKYIFCDKNRFNRMILNLLSNAFKFTPEGGKISIKVKQTGNEEGFGDYEIRVKDSGIGMSKEFAEKVFDAFERERTSTVSGIQGTGLGMAITKRIVELMKGEISVSTAPGKGTEFTVRVSFELQKDVPEEVEEKPEESQEEKEIDFSTKKILLVDDIDMNRELATMILLQFGFQVETAVNGADAVEKVSGGNYDIVLMDIQMPVMDGHEATKKIRSMPGEYFKKVPIIAMTANAFGEDVKAATDAGMNAHIAKPLDVPKMLETIKKFLR